MKILITGCAKSGTTLLARLMHSFDIPVHTKEIRLKDLCLAKLSNLVGKRNEYTIFSNILNGVDLEHQKQMIIKYDIKILNIYRNGVDVMESFENDWQYWNPLIWCESIRQMEEMKDLITTNVSYESLVTEPDLIQSVIATGLGIEPEYKFSESHHKVPMNLFKTNNPRYKSRPIVKDRIGKRFNVRKPGIDIDYFNEKMEVCGYERV